MRIFVLLRKKKRDLLFLHKLVAQMHEKISD